ncbi:hypothetical protein ABIB29_004003, partial [Arthrobacter sp. UYEF36]
STYAEPVTMPRHSVVAGKAVDGGAFQAVMDVLVSA